MYEFKPAGKRGAVKVVFSLETSAGCSVCVAGSFNDWDPAVTPMEYDLKKRVHRGSIDLGPGEYEYKFVIDGKWSLDESNPNFYPNDFGTLNSVLKITDDDLQAVSAPAGKALSGGAPKAAADDLPADSAPAGSRMTINLAKDDDLPADSAPAGKALSGGVPKAAADDR